MKSTINNQQSTIPTILLWAVLLVALYACWPAGPQTQAQPPAASTPLPTILGSPVYRWHELGTITSSQAYPAVGDRNDIDVLGLADAKTFIWYPDSWGRKAMLSFQTTADADATTIVLLAFAERKMFDTSDELTLEDDAIYGGQLALTGGTQVGSHSNVWVDSIVATDGFFSFTVCDHAGNRRATVEFNTKGCKAIVGIATTLQASSTLYAYGRLFQ